MIKAIETKYNGDLFRSRLEARWAIFFNEMRIEYTYEAEGFSVMGERYLPDFKLTDVKGHIIWCEIKPIVPPMERFRFYDLFAYEIGQLNNGLGDRSHPSTFIILIDTPGKSRGVIQVYDGLIGPTPCYAKCAWGTFTFSYSQEENGVSLITYDFFNKHSEIALYPPLSSKEKVNYNSTDQFNDRRSHHDIGHKKLIMAYRSARQARFEHGQNGVV
jgi:hypothetical protein